MLSVGCNDVAKALDAGTAVVALETAVLTHGLPRPHNLEAMQLMQGAVRAAGATPAIIAVHRGRLVVGLRDDHLEEIAEDESAVKAGARDLAAVCAQGRNAGTTVSGTLAACQLAGISVFATGGIGGVHRGWSQHRDISADLREMANTPCCVVSAGAKSVLDLPATLEALETLSVPVLGLGVDNFPQFHSLGNNSLKVSHRVESIREAARICLHHWDTLGREGGILLANPVAQEHAFDYQEIERHVEDAVTDAIQRDVRGQELTPFLLDYLAKATANRSIETNIALLTSNAQVAGNLAVELHQLLGTNQ